MSNELRTTPPAAPDPWLGESDLHFFNEGTHSRIYEKFGAHLTRQNGVEGCHFAVWAPNAARVSVIGDFNHWNPDKNPLSIRGSSGVWEGFVPGVKEGDVYKYRIDSRVGGYWVEKTDPVGFLHQQAPGTASVVARLDGYSWGDGAYMRERARRNHREAPISIYEVHLGSFMRVPEEGGRMLLYRELAPRLAEHVTRLGFTHVELLPLSEHPFYGSWGYETTGYFATTSRYGPPQDLMFLIDTLHQHGIGVILDWVPAHFPTDEHGLVYFDGTHLYEHQNPMQGYHPQWHTSIFNFGRNEVQSFLLSAAAFWLDYFHVDGLRVDAVASMLYLDYGRAPGEWVPNPYGGRENLEAIHFLRRLNEVLYQRFPDIQTFAEESTTWPMVTRPTYLGGLGFGFKWDLGWMHDTLEYLGKDPVHRKYHHNLLTFRGMYASSENFVLPLSHDEVVYGKGSLLQKMHGDYWQKFANLRLLYTYMWTLPGKKLLFMGGEFGQWREWDHDISLDWHLLEEPAHQQLQLLVGELNRLYRQEPSLHELDCDPQGFQWIDANDAEHSIYAYQRRGKGDAPPVVVVLNFTPVPWKNYRIGVPTEGVWEELLNTDAQSFGGSGHGNFGGVEAVPFPWHGHAWSINLTLPPLGALLLKRRAESPEEKS